MQIDLPKRQLHAYERHHCSALRHRGHRRKGEYALVPCRQPLIATCNVLKAGAFEDSGRDGTTDATSDDHVDMWKVIAKQPGKDPDYTKSQAFTAGQHCSK